MATEREGAVGSCFDVEKVMFGVFLIERRCCCRGLLGWCEMWRGWNVRLVMHCNENPIYVFLFWEMHGLSPNFHIHYIYYQDRSAYFPAAE